MQKPIKNKPVSHLVVDYLLSCNHVNFETIEAVIYSPRTGDKRTCVTCKQDVEIKKVFSPYWVDEEDEEK